MADQAIEAGKAFESLIEQFEMPRFSNCRYDSDKGVWVVERPPGPLGLVVQGETGDLPAGELYGSVQKWWNQRCRDTGVGEENWDSPTAPKDRVEPERIIIRIRDAAIATNPS